MSRGKILNIQNNMNKEKIIVLGAAFGVAIGSIISVFTGNPALWISLGIAFGAGLGLAYSQRKSIK
ncbi:hypothetical protein GCM10007049_09740 [Echinicola pacifica]|uniref:Glycine zipper family protein n=2 Tax=Echinicola pacifica TaxID=346377 RepID=A0A918PQ93_9BACT|nr:hypothetical protein GCM10007049_09740 [Echinicola pacifica]